MAYEKGTTVILLLLFKKLAYFPKASQAIYKCVADWL